MNGLNEIKILHEITRFYLKSPDFNGISSKELSLRLGVGFDELFDFLRDLISERKVGILHIPPFGNPSIIQIGFKSECEQIEHLTNPDTRTICLYPRPVHLQKIVNRAEYGGEPYKLALALGSPQLAFRSFDLSVLEYYRNDPRYMYENDDIRGRICYNSEQMAESDKTMLESFGFSYDADLNRAVAVFLRYLVRLSPEHQQIWKAKELPGNYKLHTDYYTNMIKGDWREHESIFQAFVDEVHLICQMTTGMGRSALFRKDFGKDREDKPKKFGFLVRPTLEEFYDFVHLLDKMISDNINRKFFQNEVPYETEKARNDGKIQVQPKGTLNILDDWMKTFYHTDNWEPWVETLKAFKEIRQKRQIPGHVIDEDVFDQKYLKEQRDLMLRAYNGMRILRMIFENHPQVRHLNIVIPDYLREGKIRTH